MIKGSILLLTYIMNSFPRNVAAEYKHILVYAETMNCYRDPLPIQWISTGTHCGYHGSLQRFTMDLYSDPVQIPWISTGSHCGYHGSLQRFTMDTMDLYRDPLRIPWMSIRIHWGYRKSLQGSIANTTDLYRDPLRIPWISIGIHCGTGIYDTMMRGQSCRITLSRITLTG